MTAGYCMERSDLMGVPMHLDGLARLVPYHSRHIATYNSGHEPECILQVDELY